MARYVHERFPFTHPPELDGRANRVPVLIVGAGPVGLALAIDLALAGVKSVVLDDNDAVAIGSRAICWSKRTLEIFDRLGVAQRMLAKGVTWKVGRLFHRDRQVYAFDLATEAGHKHPPFVNLQQYYVEEDLLARARECPDCIELRFKSRVVDVRQSLDTAIATVETPVGSYEIEGRWLVACDGVRSTVRQVLGLSFTGQAFDERFLITDVTMRAYFPPERWFWFEPPFHDGQSALLHKQPDDVWRIDLQLGPGADPEHERRPEVIVPRIRAIVGDRPFEIEWSSVYTFQCSRLERFVHGRVIFAGDAAHIVSPFGARGGNGGIQDADNLAWKLAAVVTGHAPPALLASYDEERGRGADENILNSARATSFMTPKSRMERIFREEVLAMAATQPFARRLVNSGRLSEPCSLAGLSLQSPDEDGFEGGLSPGSPCLDAPVHDRHGRPGWLLDHLGGRFVLLCIGEPVDAPEDLQVLTVGADDKVPDCASPSPHPDLFDTEGLFRARYGARHGAAYVIRPDQHVAARFARPTRESIAAALARALGKEQP